MTLKALTKLILVIVLLCSCVTTADAQPLALHRCGVSIKRATRDELVLELWSTSQTTLYSVDINYSDAPCSPWDKHGENWVKNREMFPGLYVLPWDKFYSRSPSPGMEACINWACQPEITVIYLGQDYQTVFDYLFLPLVTVAKGVEVTK